VKYFFSLTVPFIVLPVVNECDDDDEQEENDDADLVLIQLIFTFTYSTLVVLSCHSYRVINVILFHYFLLIQLNMPTSFQYA